MVFALLYSNDYNEVSRNRFKNKICLLHTTYLFFIYVCEVIKSNHEKHLYL
ncbi:protein of unknown function [Tenacibaculum jejuense]|uniref:Uncharacterized protein n=1 Tax=Tenacibaculum jejuense TaxID=584609 RepID=A0A238UF78_9FLAO|nr:protein of unknown function [Tenacibaculum jejuense]